MTPPRIYAEWLPLLDSFSEGDDAVVVLLSEGEIEWTNVVAERWTRQVSGCLSVRLQALAKQLQTGLDRARDYLAISNALLTARRGLVPLRAFVTLPAYPPDVQSYLESTLNRWASETQKSLERHAQSIRHDQGQLLKALRDNPLTALTAAQVPLHVKDQLNDGSPAPKGRRVIL